MATAAMDLRDQLKAESSEAGIQVLGSLWPVETGFFRMHLRPHSTAWAALTFNLQRMLKMSPA